MYLTYLEYKNMGGKVDESTFTDIEFEARSYVDWVTFNRLWNEEIIPERVKECMYHIINTIAVKMNILNASLGLEGKSSVSGDTGIQSQSNDGVSTSYNVISAKDALRLLTGDLYKEINRYLQGVTNSLGRKLLYKGLYKGE